MRWKDRISLLFSIFYDLKAVHSQGIVHRDLHSGNILQDSLHSSYIAYLGLSVQYMKQDEQVCGILPFVAPEVRKETVYYIYSFVGSIILYAINQLFQSRTSIRCINWKMATS